MITACPLPAGIRPDSRRGLFHFGQGIDAGLYRQVIIGHAGVAADPLEANDAETLIHDHDIVRANRYDGPLTVTGHIALEEAAWFAGDGETVELISPGETRPLPEKGVLCIDTGCGKGGKLTAMVIENGLYTLHSAHES